MLLVLFLLPLADGAAPDATNPLVSYGLLGIVLVAFAGLMLTETLVVGRAHRRVIKERDIAQARATALEDNLRSDVVPALLRSSDSGLEVAKLGGEMTAELRRLRERP